MKEAKGAAPKIGTIFQVGEGKNAGYGTVTGPDSSGLGGFNWIRTDKNGGFLKEDKYYTEEKYDGSAANIISHSNSLLGKQIKPVGQNKNVQTKSVTIGGDTYEWGVTGNPKVDTHLSHLDARSEIFEKHATDEEKAQHASNEDINEHTKNAELIDSIAKRASGESKIDKDLASMKAKPMDSKTMADIKSKMKKARGMPVGTVVTRKNGEFQKVAPNKWKRVSKNKESEAQMEEQKPEMKGEEMAHDDAAADVELIKAMLKKHGLIGEEGEPEEETMQMAREMLGAYKEMGYESEKAMECMGEAMKLASHMGKKKQEAASQQESDEMTDDDMDEAMEMEAQEAEVKESAKLRDEVIALKAELAKFKEADKKAQIAKHLDKVLSESKLTRKVTDTFRETIGEPKSTEQIDREFKIFLEAYKSDRGESGLFVFTEKAVNAETKAIGFADCLRD